MSIRMNAAARRYCFSTLTLRLVHFARIPISFFPLPPSSSSRRTMRRKRERDGARQVRDKKVFVVMYSTVDIYLIQRGRSLSMRRIFSASINNAYIRIRVFLGCFPSSRRLFGTEMSFSSHMRVNSSGLVSLRR